MKILNKTIPWWLIIVVKMVLSRLPIQYSFWKRMRLFEHGDMDSPRRAYENFMMHARMAGVIDETSSPPKLLPKKVDFNVLELGPGDSLFTIIVAKTLGASRTWLIDAAPFATEDMAKYHQLVKFLRQQGYTLTFEKLPDTLDELLKSCNGEYLLAGVQSLAHVPNASIDFCFSQTVLQHIPKNDFVTMVNELHRVLKPEGACNHRIDLKDMLDGKLNNLRFSESVWESALFRKSGFYTNRLRFRQMVTMFEQAGFKCTVPRIVRWSLLPTPRTKMDTSFMAFSDEDLLVSGFDITLMKS